MRKSTLSGMTLSDAAVRLRRSYGQTLRLLFIGEITGWKADGRWFVEAGSVEKFARQKRQTRKEAGRGGSDAV